MGKSEVIITLITSTIGFAILIACIFIFIIQYRNRKIEHTKETDMLNEKHTQELLEKKLETQQETMQHIGREIHDNVGQKLTLASLYTKQLATKNNNNPDEKIIAISTIIDESLNELRQLSKTLTNPHLAQADLLFLLKEEAKRINNAGVCHVIITSNSNILSLSQSSKNVLFRLLQEFMQNSLKHSGCKKISINAESLPNQLIITATDDGKGFDTNAQSTGIGLQNMQRRAEELGATYTLKSTQAKGTIMTISLSNYTNQ